MSDLSISLGDVLFFLVTLYMIKCFCNVVYSKNRDTFVLQEQKHFHKFEKHVSRSIESENKDLC
jgi:hypothetical protein